MEEIIFWVTGMAGEACRSRIGQFVTEVPGVTRLYVDLSRNEVTVWGTASREAVEAAIRAAGFGLSPFPVPEQRGVG